MASLFSERYRYKEADVLQPDVMPDALRKRFWNAIEKFIEEHHERNEIIEKIWDEFLKQDKNDLRAHYGHYGVETYM